MQLSDSIYLTHGKRLLTLYPKGSNTTSSEGRCAIHPVHKWPSLPRFPVSPNNTIAGVSNRPNVKRTSPKGWHFEQERKLLPQYAGGHAFDLVHNKVRGMVRRNSNGQVNMVGHKFQRNHFTFEFRNLFAYQHFASFFDFAHQTLTAVLRAKDNVIVQVINTAARFLIIACHQEYYKLFLWRLSRKCRPNLFGQFLPCLKAVGVSSPTLSKGLL